jgi:beta-glucanase (GH16 family)
MGAKIRDPILAFCAVLILDGGSAHAAGAGWKPVWNDEFAASEVDAAAWGFESGYLRNDEDQFYTNRAENSRIEDGKLLIQARRDGWSGHAYTSASRTTRGKRSWKYGRFEMRARIDVRPGSWPAWWWLPDSGGWPQGGEIDMMEAYQGKCLFNVMDGHKKWSSPTRSVAALGGDRWAAAYHTWAMDWDSAKIDLYLDGALMNRYPLDSAEGSGPGGSNPFRHPGYLIVNQAIGGTQGGDPSATAFPVELRIEWIRVHAWAEGPAHLLTVAGGWGGGQYLEGALASVTAAPAPAGQVFDRWVVAAGAAAIAEPQAEDIRLPMPAGDLSLRATYKVGSALRIPGRRGRAMGRIPFLEPAEAFRFASGPAFTLTGRAVPAESPDGPAARVAPGAYFLP